MHVHYDFSHLRLHFSLLIIAAVLVITSGSFAQVSSGGMAPSLSYTLSQSPRTVTMPAVNTGEYLAEDEHAPKDVPLRFGVPFEVSLDLSNSGAWTTLPNGDRIWRLRIESAGAYSINLIYDRFQMPDGAQLFLYNDNYRFVIGAFTSYNNKDHGGFSTQPVPDDAITLEYYEPAAVQGEGVISIMRVVHAYRNLFGYHSNLDAFGDSGACNNNVACDDEWDDQERSVVMLLTAGGFRYCTGSLINRVSSDGTPYVLTANHCGPGSNDMAMFNYQSPICTPNQNGPTNMTVSGGTVRFANGTSDGCLWELSVPVPLSYNPFFNGWTAIDSAASQSVCIHHPSGDVKKISWDFDPATTTSYLGMSSPGDGTHWRIADWEDGTTEGGSSGSPLFDQNHRVTGQLHGGWANCSNNVNDYYGKFQLSMTLGLRPWLDPDNSGIMAIDGFDPNVAGRVQGIVTGSDTQAPLNGVMIEVIDGTQSVMTDSDGYYNLPLPDGTFDLRFSRFAYADHEENNITIAEGDTIILNVEMTAVAAGAVTGAVLAGQMAPVMNAEASILDTPVDPVRTDENGEFFFSLPGGTYDLQITFADIIFDTTIIVPANGAIEFDVYLASDRSLTESGDAYGYAAYEGLDLTLPPEFDWVEIAPAEGGPGEEIIFGGPDYFHHMSIDEPFVFYGQSFDSITINENGWVAPGISYNQTSNNTTIPSSPNGPEGTLALYWDNLHDGVESQVSWWYDSEHCRLIIEYYRMQFLPLLDSLLTCQVQIYSANAWPTPTGDSEILYLYQQIGSPTTATVGIENLEEDDGVLVQFNTLIGNYSWPVGPGTAILITTRDDVRATGIVTGNITAHPTATDYSEALVQINCDPLSIDEGGGFNESAAFVGERHARLEWPGYESWSIPVTVTEGGTSDIEFEVWRLDPPRDVTGYDEFNNIVLEWEPPLSLEEGTDHFVEYIVYYEGEEIGRSPDESFMGGLGQVPSPVELWVTALYEGGVSDTSNHVWITLAGDGNTNALPTKYSLSSAYPNPFNATTTIDFALPHASEVTMIVFDILGREVAQLTNARYEAGYHSLRWNADAQATGLYVLQMTTESFRSVQKLLLLK